MFLFVFSSFSCCYSFKVVLFGGECAAQRAAGQTLKAEVTVDGFGLGFFYGKRKNAREFFCFTFCFALWGRLYNARTLHLGQRFGVSTSITQIKSVFLLGLFSLRFVVGFSAFRVGFGAGVFALVVIILWLFFVSLSELRSAPFCSRWTRVVCRCFGVSTAITQTSQFGFFGLFSLRFVFGFSAFHVDFGAGVFCIDCNDATW